MQEAGYIITENNFTKHMREKREGGSGSCERRRRGSDGVHPCRPDFITFGWEASTHISQLVQGKCGSNSCTPINVRV